MKIETRNANGVFIELMTDQQETTCFSVEEAQDVLFHLLDVVDDLKIFIKEK